MNDYIIGFIKIILIILRIIIIVSKSLYTIFHSYCSFAYNMSVVIECNKSMLYDILVIIVISRNKIYYSMHNT